MEQITKSYSIKTGNERIQSGLLLPDLNSLMGDIWQTGELIFFFGGTGSAKVFLLFKPLPK